MLIVVPLVVLSIIIVWEVILQASYVNRLALSILVATLLSYTIRQIPEYSCEPLKTPTVITIYNLKTTKPPQKNYQFQGT